MFWTTAFLMIAGCFLTAMVSRWALQEDKVDPYAI